MNETNQKAVEMTAGEPSCRVCGCIDELACPGGHYRRWVRKDLCNICEDLLADWRPRVPAIFADCVAASDSRFSLSRPFAIESFVAATDRRICVRVPNGDCPGFVADPKAVAPRIGELDWERSHYRSVPIPLPDVGPEVHETCERCGGDGLVVCNLEHEHDCPDCDGEGQIARNEPVAVGDGLPMLAERYLRILDKAWAALYPAVEPRSTHGTPNPYRFDVPGTRIEGLLCPLIQPGVEPGLHALLEAWPGRWTMLRSLLYLLLLAGADGGLGGAGAARPGDQHAGP